MIAHQPPEPAMSQPHDPRRRDFIATSAVLAAAATVPAEAGHGQRLLVVGAERRRTDVRKQCRVESIPPGRLNFAHK